jgi:hypothetical protein
MKAEKLYYQVLLLLIIDAETTGKQLVTKEWAVSKIWVGLYVDLLTNQNKYRWK